MATTYANDTISGILDAIRNGFAVRTIATVRGIPESTIRGWLKRYPNGMDNATDAQATQEGGDSADNATVPAEVIASPADNPSSIAQDATTGPNTTDDAESTPDASQVESGPIINGPVAIGDTLERYDFDSQSWEQWFNVADFMTACSAYGRRSNPLYRIMRDGAQVIPPDGLSNGSHPYDGRTQGLRACRLDGFYFSSSRYTGYELAFDDNGVIREFRHPLDNGTLTDWKPFSDACGDLPGHIIEYVSQRIPVQVPALPVDTTNDATDDSDDDDDDDSDGLTCVDCVREIKENNGIEHDGEWRCDDCHYESFDTCNHCGSTVAKDDGTWEDDDFWCDYCHSDHFTSCSRCSDIVPNEDTITTASGDDICQDCYENHYFTCDDCNEVSNYDHSISTDDGTYCEDCASSHSSGVIRDYSDKSANHMSKLGDSASAKKTYGIDWLGVELEVCSRSVNNRDDDAQEVIDALGDDFVVLKEDGSLPSGGFEIVSCPATVPIHAERWRNLMVEHPVSGLKSWDARGCGMHVHVSRKGISALTLGKMLVFVNDERHADLITVIAGRDANNYCQRSKKKIADAQSRRWDRYEAINLTNSATVEFRIFKGTLKYSSFMKNLEFVSAVILFCKLAGCQELTIPHFRDFLESYKLRYPYLYAFLATKGYVKPSRRVDSVIKGQPVGAEV